MFRPAYGALLLTPLFSLTPAAALASVSAASVEVGYKAHSPGTLARNPGAFDQPYLQLDYRNLDDWGRLFSSTKLENPGQLSRDQQGQSGRTTFKSLNVVEPVMWEGRLNALLQNFISASTSTVEDNFYLGASRDLDLGAATLTVGAGLHYAFGSFAAKGLSYSGPSGYFATLNLSYPFRALGRDSALSIAYNGQFDRAEGHQEVFRYDDYGHQWVNTLKTSLSERVYAKVYLSHLDSIGATPQGDLEYGLAFGLSL
ncbi:outer membrane protein OmpK [Ferrimonas balearica]|uniref:outer membrane protein OmpK n=1 Tax=Ferrimonas balearica TaxID=44012 RepID=UPI001C595678|nr:outer membrane protein OmpK [Ferrimonas balearica]MBW3164701.1 outer membrane protein OmpK [Ferrimonas balearica]